MNYSTATDIVWITALAVLAIMVVVEVIRLRK